MKAIKRFIVGACCLCVGMCAVSGNGMTLGVKWIEPHTGAEVEWRTAK